MNKSMKSKAYNPELTSVIEALLGKGGDLFPGTFVLFQRPKALDMAIQVATPELIDQGAISWSVFPKAESDDRDISELRHYIEQKCLKHEIMRADGEPNVNWPRHGGMTAGEHGVLVPRISTYCQWHPRKHNGIVPKNVKWAGSDCYLSWVSSRVAQQRGGSSGSVVVF